MKPFDANGNELDAKYNIETTERGFDLVLESRGGGVNGPRPVRNGNYGPALTLLLERMAVRGMTLASIQLASSRSSGLDPKECVLDVKSYPFPIQLSHIASAEELRLAVGRASALTRQKPGAKGGNSNKRLRFIVEWAPASKMSATQIAKLLALPVTSTLPSATVMEAPTDDPLLFEERIVRARAKLAHPVEGMIMSIPAGSEGRVKVKSTTARFTRDPEIVAWVLENAKGMCEVCNGPAPFIRTDGYPYLEVHHVRPLAEGGPDKIDNAVGVCPNCHRHLHHGHKKDELRTKLIAKLRRIFDYPLAAVEVLPENEGKAAE